MSPIAAPFDRFEGVVKPEWMDLNGHMNLAYYLVLFDHALDLACAEWDLDWVYTKRTNHGTFAVETHTLYEQELMAGDRVRVRTWLLGVDAKRVHIGHELFRAADMVRSACWEVMMLHVDLGTRKVVPWPEEQLRLLEATAAAHRATGLPDWVGRKVRTLG